MDDSRDDGFMASGEEYGLYDDKDEARFVQVGVERVSRVKSKLTLQFGLSPRATKDFNCFYSLCDREELREVLLRDSEMIVFNLKGLNKKAGVELLEDDTIVVVEDEFKEVRRRGRGRPAKKNVNSQTLISHVTQ